MSKQPLSMALAKVIIAAAWADGHLAHDEINALKNLLAELGQTGGYGEMALTANEWAELEIYLYSPVAAAERERLVAELAAALHTERDRALALTALDTLLRSDRVLTSEEYTVATEIRNALAAADLGAFGQLGRMLRRILGARAGGPNRERYLDEFLHNRIYYAVRQRLGKDPEDDLGMSHAEAHTLALAGGLLAYVARIDQGVSEAKRAQIIAALRAGWGLDDMRATLVAEAALAESAAGLDYYRLTHEFAASADVPERARFLDALFAVAAADGTISSAESAEISRITQSINLTHDDYIAALRRARG